MGWPASEEDASAKKWRRGVGLCLLGCLVGVVGIGIGWGLHHSDIPPHCPGNQNQTVIGENEERVRQLQNTIANLTATAQRYKSQLKECEGSLARSTEQLTMKSGKLSECTQERGKCNQDLQACNHVSTLHKKHPWWVMVSILSAMLLYS
ncbi:uncharacterized protein LOC144607140 [Rhinoraja longicauda]